mmetsp:Transcript_2456/g.5740  ORF Transcript_2456/g.5740 Transcript_2456/m.5740 type:complete len:119 (+) Transcript_2456:1287-1643(+)
MSLQETRGVNKRGGESTAKIRRGGGDWEDLRAGTGVSGVCGASCVGRRRGVAGGDLRAARFQGGGCSGGSIRLPTFGSRGTAGNIGSTGGNMMASALGGVSGPSGSSTVRLRFNCRIA